MSEHDRILYCHCTYAQVVPAEVKQEVLRRLAESGVAFDAVADLCELSARRDPALKELVTGIGAEGGATLKIAACYRRAVNGLFVAAGVPLPEAVEVLNMRTETADQVVQALINGKSPAAEALVENAGVESAPVESATVE